MSMSPTCLMHLESLLLIFLNEKRHISQPFYVQCRSICVHVFVSTFILDFSVTPITSTCTCESELMMLVKRFPLNRITENDNIKR